MHFCLYHLPQNACYEKCLCGSIVVSHCCYSKYVIISWIVSAETDKVMQRFCFLTLVIFYFSWCLLDNVISNCDSYWNSCSENFLVRWDSTGMPKEIEKLNNLPALFTVSESQPTACIPSASDLNNPDTAWNLWQISQFAPGSLLICWKLHWMAHIHATSLTIWIHLPPLFHCCLC